MPAPSNKKKPAKKATTSKPVATATPATVQSLPTPPTSTSQPPVRLKTAATKSEPLPLDFTFFLDNASFSDINRFVDTVSTTNEGRNLQLLWRRAVREGRDMGYEQGQSEGYEIGYQDCEDKYRDPREDWKELERSLKVNLEPENEPKPTTADAASQTEPQFDQSKDVNTLADPLPPVQPSPTVVDTSPSLLLSENLPDTSVAKSSDPTSLELENHVASEAITPPVPPLMDFEPLDPLSVTPFSSSSPVGYQEGSVQTVPAVEYEMPADPEVLDNACTRASNAASNTPLGAIWNCAAKSGFDKGSCMVEGMLVTDVLKIGFERGNIYRVIAGREHHSQTCLGTTPRSMCEAGVQVIDADPLNNPDAIDILCAFSSTAPSTTPFGLIWQRAFQAGTEVPQVQTPHHINISTQTSIPSPPPPQDTIINWSDDPVEIQPMFPPPPPKYEPRDLSILRSSSPAPFSSLERRSKRSYTRPHQSRQSRRHYATSYSNSPRKFTTPKKSFHSKIPPSSSSFAVATSLDWDRDPRLSNLSRALKALGWVQNF